MDDNFSPERVMLLVAALANFSISLRMGVTVFLVRELDARSRFVLTQRRRYAWLLAGVLGALAAFAWPVAQLGGAGMLAVLDAWCSQHPLVGGTVSLAYAMGAYALVLALPTWKAIMRYPARAAKKVAGGYVLTRDVRERTANPVLLQREAVVDDSRWIKRYRLVVVTL